MKLEIATIMLLAAALSAGCASKSAAPPEKPPTAFGCPVASKRINSMEELLEAKVATAGSVPDVKVTHLQCTMQNDLLRIDAVVVNEASDVRRIAYRFEWVDRNGMKAWNDESWKPVYLYENSRETVVSSAPSGEAVDFRLVLLDQDRERK
jgi:uncharacterized protein YcfL